MTLALADILNSFFVVTSSQSCIAKLYSYFTVSSLNIGPRSNII